MLNHKRQRGNLISLFLAILAIANLLSSPACQKPDDTQMIKGILTSIVRQAEKKDKEKILSYLSPDYLDFNQRNIQQTEELIDFYFKHYSGIAIHPLSISVSINGDNAEAEADVLLSSGPLETFRKLVGLVGSFYRFDFKLERLNQEWKIIYSAWREIDSGSLLPGSKAVLKKLFPDLIQ